MKTIIKLSLVAIIILLGQSCKTEAKKDEVTEVSPVEKNTQIEMVTSKGTIVLELYNETPLHRDNFVKLANQKAFDSLIFHRVIETFMIQGGDPESKFAKAGDTLGSGDLEYMVDAEIRPNLFHKKGVLAAARDGNLARASSAMQFYIVQGKVYNDSLLAVSEKRINNWLAGHYFKNLPENKPMLDAIDASIEAKDKALYTKLNDSLDVMIKAYDNFERYIIPDEHRMVYKTVGGTPHLDQNYTVYGEVISGLEVVDSIAASPTSELDRPLADVRIVSVRVVNQ